jgi:hypothetical protein
VCSGCGTAQLYDGPRRSSDEVAHITGDLRINAGSPLTLILRAVDDTPLNVGQNGVDVLPGKHRLLVDCRIAETGNVSRYSIEPEVSAGRHYKLVAETGPGLRECTQVTLQTVDF